MTKLSLKVAFYNSTGVLKFYHQKTAHTYLVKKVQNSTPIIVYKYKKQVTSWSKTEKKLQSAMCSHISYQLCVLTA